MDLLSSETRETLKDLKERISKLENRMERMEVDKTSRLLSKGMTSKRVSLEPGDRE